MSAAKRLTVSQETLAKIEARLAELSERRAKRLLAGDNAAAIAKIDQELATLRQEAATERDRAALLIKETEREEREAAAKRREATIQKVSRRLDENVVVAEAFEKKLGEAIDLFRTLCHARSALLPVFQLGSAEVNVAANNPSGTALTVGAVTSLVAFEIRRQGSHGFVGGGPVIAGQPVFPGGLAPTISLQNMPEAITPISQTLRDANAYALRLLEGIPIIIDPSDKPPAPKLAAQAPSPEAIPQLELKGTPSPPDPMQRQAALLLRLNELSKDSSQESAYQRVLQEIAELTAGG